MILCKRIKPMGRDISSATWLDSGQLRFKSPSVACFSRAPKRSATPVSSAGDHISHVPASIDDAYLVSSFSTAYPALASKIDTADKVRSLVNISHEIREWYLELKADSAIVSSLPLSMQEGGCSPEMWRAAQLDLARAKAAEKSWSDEVNAASATFRKVIDSVNSKRQSFYKTCSPMIVIARLNQDNLKLDDQVEIALESDPDKRKLLVRAKVDALQKQSVRDFINGQWSNPFA